MKIIILIQQKILLLINHLFIILDYLILILFCYLVYILKKIEILDILISSLYETYILHASFCLLVYLSVHARLLFSWSICLFTPLFLLVTF